jgi:hypothetical protein
MGMISPKDGSYQPIVATVTHHLGPARKAEDVIAYKLADGTVVGAKEFQAYDAKRKEILSRLVEAQSKLQASANAELAESLKSLMASAAVK